MNKISILYQYGKFNKKINFHLYVHLLKKNIKGEPRSINSPVCWTSLLVLPFFYIKMANPQKEDGYTAIANEIIEALIKTKMSGQEWQVLFTILRKTYGYNKKADNLPLSQISYLTGMDRSRVCEALKSLKKRNIIVRENVPSITQKRTSIPKTMINKDYEDWKGLRKNVLVRKNVIASTLKRNKTLRKNVPSKDNTKVDYSKEKITRFKKPSLDEIKDYFKEKGSTFHEAEKFYQHYESNGWHVGKNKMSKWRAAASGWIMRNHEVKPEIKSKMEKSLAVGKTIEYDKCQKLARKRKKIIGKFVKNVGGKNEISKNNSD